MPLEPGPARLTDGLAAFDHTGVARNPAQSVVRVTGGGGGALLREAAVQVPPPLPHTTHPPQAHLPLPFLLPSTCIAPPSGHTAVTVTCVQGSVELIEALIEVGVSVFDADMDCHTALHSAASHGRHHACRVLVANGADPASKVRPRRTAPITVPPSDVPPPTRAPITVVCPLLTPPPRA